ncbi:MAG: hypothetical protein IKT32_07715 [Clostridia bacterium]|nr:hypothetical protein [Clostridia bacterium]
MTKFVKEIYMTEGRQILRQCKEKIEEYNLEFGKELNLPERVPIYTDYEVKFRVGYEKFYSTYFLNGYYFGLENDDVPVIHVPPFAKVFLTEVQRYYDSRKSASLKPFVSRLYEMHRHNNIDIYLDLQRLSLLDLNIRDLAKQIIFIEDLTHHKDGEIILSSTWKCKKFASATDADRYFNEGANTYENVTFKYEGDIFKCYDSFSNKDKFIPKNNYNYLEHGKVTKDNKEYYEFNMPKYFRGQKKEEKNNEPNTRVK